MEDQDRLEELRETVEDYDRLEELKGYNGGLG